MTNSLFTHCIVLDESTTIGALEASRVYYVERVWSDAHEELESVLWVIGRTETCCGDTMFCDSYKYYTFIERGKWGL